MTTIIAATKGNNGRAARRRLYQKVTALLSVLMTLAVMAWYGDRRQAAASRQPRSSRHLSSSRLRRPQQAQLPPLAAAAASGEDDDDEKALQAVVRGHYSLVDLSIVHGHHHHDDDNDQGSSSVWVRGHFCAVDWTAHKADPASTPMFRNVLQASPGCHDPVILDLQPVVKAARQYDDEEKNNDPAAVHLLDLAGLVFHESRCGSTLVANVLQAMDPVAHRVYSESQPPLHAARLADDVGPTAAAHILADVVYLMRRSVDPAEQRVFFKIQSIGTTVLPVFRQAFPETPWIFVYRDPTAVLVSQLEHGVHAANCVRAQAHRPSRLVRQLVHRRRQGTSVDALPPESLCAAHLAAITETAVTALRNDPVHGTAVNYHQLPHRLYDDLLPHHFGVPITTAALARMQAVAGVYSKGGRGHQQQQQKKNQAFTSDAQQKKAQATVAMQEAAQQFLQESYEQLEVLAGVVTTVED